jgi:hypothetical protein
VLLMLLLGWWMPLVQLQLHRKQHVQEIVLQPTVVTRAHGSTLLTN